MAKKKKIQNSYEFFKKKILLTVVVDGLLPVTFVIVWLPTPMELRTAPITYKKNKHHKMSNRKYNKREILKTVDVKLKHMTFKR